MCDQTEINYLDGDVVWVKLGSCWWPGEVVGPEKLPPDVLPSFRKPPIAVVKFFQESTYEYVKNINSIYKYNCSRKNEFINKGLYMYRTKHGHMEKFPEDVIRAETAVGGDKEILTRDEFQEQKKESYAGLFGDKKTPASGKRGRGRGRPSAESPKLGTPSRKFLRDKSDYKVHILVQPSKETPSKTSQNEDDKKKEPESSPSTSRAGSEVADDKPPKTDFTPNTPSTPTISSSGIYSCPNCAFTTSRLNVLILHNKTHSVGYMPYTPSPVRKKPVSKSSTKSTPKTSKSPKTPRPRKEKIDKEKALKKEAKSKKRVAVDKPEVEIKKPKTDEEIKSSLLADWDDDADDESTDETSLLITRSPELPVGSESPAAPTSAELPAAEKATEGTSSDKKPDELSVEKPASSDSKYEFCEDEDWPIEADGGRKIPRVKNPSKRKDAIKSLSLDENDVAKEVAELLNSTSVPELPSIPEPLKAEENFPEPSIVKSPDKKPDSTSEPSKAAESSTIEPKPTKAIFKTKTFFRSRHSRSQDAIGKYVAEQLNPERLDLADNDLNGSEVVSSPELRESPPIDHVKVARLAPKIQLKKMKAEAAQLEKERCRLEAMEESRLESNQLELAKEDLSTTSMKSMLDVIYPTQEIKPINKETPEKIHHKEDNKDKLENEEIKQPDEILNQSHDQVLNDLCPNKEIPVDELLEAPNKLEKCINIDNPQSKEQEHSIQNINTFSMDYMPRKQPINKKWIKHLNLENDSTDNSDISQEKSINSSATVKAIQETLTKIEGLNLAAPKKVDVKSTENSLLKESPVKTQNLTTTLKKTYEQLTEPYMSASTASAVDALLSVSRDTDRVPKIISSGPPEDLFEDDNKDTNNDEQELNIGNNSTIEEQIDISVKDNCINEDTIEKQVDISVKDKSVNEDQLDVEQDKITMQELNTENNIGSIHIDYCTVDGEKSIEIGQIQNDDTENNKQEIIETPETNVIDNVPSESDLQIAETLLNLPSTAMQSSSIETQENNGEPMNIDDQTLEETVLDNEVTIDRNRSYDINDSMSNTEITPEMFLTNHKNLNIRFETEQEKSENLNAAQSLVQMSESIDHSVNIVENNQVHVQETPKPKFHINQNNGVNTSPTVEQKIESLSAENNSESANGISNSPKFESTSKLLKILEEPTTVKPPISKVITKQTPIKQVVVTGKEKILNIDVAKSPLKSKATPPKQVIIRKTGTGSKTLINNLNCIGDVVASPDKLILSRTNVSGHEGSSVQTFTIKTPNENITSHDPKQIIIHPKLRKVTKTATKLQKIKPQNSLVQWPENKTVTETAVSEEAMFDINSMPVVLSDDILTPENIDKMPIVMTDGNINIITSTTKISASQEPTPPKLVKTSKPKIIENEKIAISASPSKPEVNKKTLLVNPVSEVNKVSTPNILSKSTKLRGAKPMLVIDKVTGKQKIIMTKGDPNIKEIKPAQPQIIQPALQQKPEKYIILPSGGPSRSGRSQKIVIDPQTGKAHVLVAKSQDTAPNVPENKPVSAKLIPSSSDAASPGNTVMIITNAQGAQSRIVLTPEHEKILFPNKVQPSVSQLKTITQRISSNATVTQKTIVNAASPAKPPPRIVPKQQKSAIITSKGQLIVGGRVATTAQNIAPMPEIRPVPKTETRIQKRIVTSEPKKIVQAIHKPSSEPLIFFQPKPGALMQLTAAQFEHLQKTGQIIQKVPVPPEKQIVVQKQITISPRDSSTPTIHTKQRVRKSASASPMPPKKQKQEIHIAPVPVPAPAPPPAPAPAPTIVTPPPLASLSSTVPDIPTIVPAVSNTISISTSSTYSDLDHLEELLPSTAIVKQPEPVPEPAPAAEPAEAPAQLADGQLLAVPGENFGGPAGSFYLCIEDNGSFTPIDNRPLVLENNQLVPLVERQDILQAALASSDVFREPRDPALDFRDLNANVSVHCRVSETSTVLHQPIMTPVELPSKPAAEPARANNLEDGLAVIGVTPHAVPTSLELPITVTDPRIAPKTTDPLSNNNYGAHALLPSPSGGGEMAFAPAEEAGPAAAGGISMPLLTEEEAGGKSMPLLTDEGSERAPSADSSGSADDWPRRLHTPITDGSDASEASAEIPLQPALHISPHDMPTS